MSFVFVSHSDADKDRIRHVVEALIGDGHKVWLDNPDKMYNAQYVKENFTDLKLLPGANWRAQIDQALRECAAVVVCWSRNARDDRYIWNSEATYARTSNKLIACKIDDVVEATLHDDFGKEQIVDVSPERDGQGARINTLLEAVRKKMIERQSDNMARRGKQGIGRASLLPYLIDRSSQENAVKRGLDGIVQAGKGVRAFLVSGPANECLPGFLERLEKDMSPSSLGGGQTWQTIHVDWPSGAAPRDFVLDYATSLGKQIGRSAVAGNGEFARGLAALKRPAAVVSQLSADDGMWYADEPDRVGAWLDFWTELAAQNQSFQAIAILCVIMPTAKSTSWFAKNKPHPDLSMGTVRTDAIWKTGEELAKQRESFNSLKVLHPLSRDDARVWLQRLRQDALAATAALSELEKRIDRLFKPGFFGGKKLVAHEEFVETVRPDLRSLLEGDGRTS